MARIEVLNPFRASVTVTSSSAQGHHVPYGGTVSCDMDVDTDSRGAPVFFRLATSGAALRGRVESVRPACASGRIEDGGSVVVIALERENGDATGFRVAYAHLDPVAVDIGDLVDTAGTLIGALGPEVAQDWGPEAGMSGHAHPPEDPRRAEYHSSCAQHSHLHLEGFGAEAVMRARGRPGDDEAMAWFTTADDPAAADLSPTTTVVEAVTSFTTDDATRTEDVEAEAGTYTVTAGESLLEIAAKLGVPLAALVAANVGLVEAGDELTVPGQVYVVRPRDTLAEIAARFSVGLGDLVVVNSIVDADRIEVGQVLMIPR